MSVSFVENQHFVMIESQVNVDKKCPHDLCPTYYWGTNFIFLFL